MSLLQRIFSRASYYGEGSRVISESEVVDVVRQNCGIVVQPRDRYYTIFTPEREQVFVREFMFPRILVKQVDGNDGEDCDDYADDITVGTRRAWRKMTGGTGKPKAVGWVRGGWKAGGVITVLHRPAFSITTAGILWWDNFGLPYNPAFSFVEKGDI